MMSKVINIHTGKEREIESFNCSICNDKFSENESGLQRGIIGSTFVSLCPICFKGMINLVDYFNEHIPIEE